jgi:hypothetical protein
VANERARTGFRRRAQRGLHIVAVTRGHAQALVGQLPAGAPPAKGRFAGTRPTTRFLAATPACCSFSC